MKDRVNDIAEKYGVSRFDWKQAVKQKREKAKQERAKEAKELTQAEKYIRERHGEEWSSTSWKETLRKKIDEAKGVCTSRAEFVKYLFENYGIEMPRNTNKTVSFKHPAVDETVRGVKLGAEYTAESIDEIIGDSSRKGK
jgi:acyl-CoA reductase-like NAD-dependent aldehyde dehydrogenase